MLFIYICIYICIKYRIIEKKNFRKFGLIFLFFLCVKKCLAENENFIWCFLDISHWILLWCLITFIHLCFWYRIAESNIFQEFRGNLLEVFLVKLLLLLITLLQLDKLLGFCVIVCVINLHLYLHMWWINIIERNIWNEFCIYIYIHTQTPANFVVLLDNSCLSYWTVSSDLLNLLDS